MEPVHVSTSSKVLFKKVRKIVPPLLEKFHKGQHGRVAVIGGSLEYVEWLPVQLFECKYS
jgi:ATP-dependent NAD(P)H-hydrate dehydratase